MAKRKAHESQIVLKENARPVPVDRARAEIISQPSVRVMTKWTPRHLYGLERSADNGDLWMLADLCDQMKADDRFGTLLQTLAGQVLGSDLTFEKDDTTGTNTAEKAKELREDWPRAYARDELQALIGWTQLVGVGFGKHEHWLDTESGRIAPRFRCWHPKHFRYDWQIRSWMVREADNVFRAITPGDGTWVICTREGEYRPWASGLWRGLARWWLLKSYAISDWGIHSEKSSKLILEGDETVTAEDRQSLAQELFTAAKDAVISLPIGFKLHLVELTTNTRDIYQAQVDAADMAAAICVLGQNLTTRVDGGSYSATVQHAKKEGALVRYVSASFSTALKDQSLSWWAKYNFGDDSFAPYPRWNTDPPEDKGAKVISLGVFSTAVMNLKTAGYRIALDKIEEVYGFEGIEEVSPEEQKAAVDAQQPTPQAPAQLPPGGAVGGAAGGGSGKVLPFPKQPRKLIAQALMQAYADGAEREDIEAIALEMEGLLLQLDDITLGAPDQPRIPSGGPGGGQWTSGRAALSPEERATLLAPAKAKLRTAAAAHAANPTEHSERALGHAHEELKAARATAGSATGQVHEAPHVVVERHVAAHAEQTSVKALHDVGNESHAQVVKELKDNGDSTHREIVSEARSAAKGDMRGAVHVADQELRDALAGVGTQDKAAALAESSARGRGNLKDALKSWAAPKVERDEPEAAPSKAAKSGALHPLVKDSVSTHDAQTSVSALHDVGHETYAAVRADGGSKASGITAAKNDIRASVRISKDDLHDSLADLPKADKAAAVSESLARAKANLTEALSTWAPKK